MTYLVTAAERRRVEMAEKRAKLAALRKAREEREASLASSRASPAQTRPPSTLGGERPLSSAGSRHDEIESLLRNVGVGAGNLTHEQTPGRESGGTSVAGSEDVTQAFVPDAQDETSAKVAAAEYVISSPSLLSCV